MACEGKKKREKKYEKNKKHETLTKLATNVTWLGFVGLKFLSDDGEVDLVCGQAQHDEISVGATQNMLRVGVVVWLGALLTDEVHDLVLSLPRDIGI